MDDVGSPAQFLDRFEYAARIEDGAFGVVGVFDAVFVVQHHAFVEVVVIVDKIHLHARGLYAGHLDDQWVVRVVDDDVQSRESDDFVQLVAAFVDISPPWHKSTDFVAFFLYALGYLTAGDGHLRGFYVGNNLLGDEQDFLHYSISLGTLCRCCRLCV